MCLLIESIKVQTGILHNIDYHNQRLNRVRQVLWPGSLPIFLQEHILLDDLDSQMYKCRVLYNKGIEQITFVPYTSKCINSLRLITHDSIDYQYKWANRSAIDVLFAQRGFCDDVLIVKKGYITDTSYANIAFYDGSNWFTPDKPLLQGTQRQKLLNNNMIKKMKIKPSDLVQFEKATIFNAMREFDPEKIIDIKAII
jgi:4-amino-4-deoxychorismate lyase